MSLPAYPDYKASGVDWLGEVPAHWSVMPLKHRVAAIESGVSVNAIDTPAADGAVGVLKTSCVYSGDFNPSENKAVLPEELSRVACRVRKDALIVSRMNTPDLVGAAGLVLQDWPNLCLPDRLWQVCFDGLFPAFAYRWTHTRVYRAQVERACAGTSSSMQNLGQDDFRAFLLAVPPIDEQVTIAGFLDLETAKIDALIAEQEKLIALRAEKRQATISHAVTRGLNPEAATEDTGVPWLGRIPKHWAIRPLRRVIKAIEQGWSPECDAREAEPSEWGVLKAGCLNGGVFRSSENKALPPGLTPETDFEVRPGDVLMSRASGSPELVGSTALVLKTRPRLLLSDKIFRLRLQASMTPKYFVAALNSRALRVQIENALSGGNGMANNLPQSNLLTFSMPIPPVAEQQAIADFVEAETQRLSALSDDCDRAIALLRERRSALITAAVTGQIDVRGAAGVAQDQPQPTGETLAP